MQQLNFSFLEQASTSKIDVLESELQKVGEAITKYARHYFYYMVSTAPQKVGIDSAELWILIPKIGYDYRVLALHRKTSHHISVKLYGFGLDPIEEKLVNIKNDKSDLNKTIDAFLNSEKANATFRFLIEKVEEDMLEAA